MKIPYPAYGKRGSGWLRTVLLEQHSPLPLLTVREEHREDAGDTDERTGHEFYINPSLGAFSVPFQPSFSYECIQARLRALFRDVRCLQFSRTTITGTQDISKRICIPEIQEEEASACRMPPPNPQSQDGLSSGLALVSIHPRGYQSPARSTDIRHTCASIPGRHSGARKSLL